MTRWVRLLVVGATALVAAVSATAAPAASSVAVTIKLVELLKAPPFTFPNCPDIGVEFNCGRGEFRPFGRASEVVSINACGDNCTLPGSPCTVGRSSCARHSATPSCPGACVTQWPHGAPFSGTLTADVVYGQASSQARPAA